MTGGKTTIFEAKFHCFFFLGMFCFNVYIVCILKVHSVSKNTRRRNEGRHQVRSRAGIKDVGKRGDNRERRNNLMGHGSTGSKYS